MRVIIDIPDLVFNGAAAMFMMGAPELTSVTMDIMEKCHSTEEFDLSLNEGKEEKGVEMALAVVVMQRMANKLLDGDGKKDNGKQDNV